MRTNAFGKRPVKKKTTNKSPNPGINHSTVLAKRSSGSARFVIRMRAHSPPDHGRFLRATCCSLLYAGLPANQKCRCRGWGPLKKAVCWPRQRSPAVGKTSPIKSITSVSSPCFRNSNSCVKARYELEVAPAGLTTLGSQQDCLELPVGQVIKGMTRWHGCKSPLPPNNT